MQLKLKTQALFSPLLIVVMFLVPCIVEIILRFELHLVVKENVLGWAINQEKAGIKFICSWPRFTQVLFKKDSLFFGVWVSHAI
ncbi:hypothetical protein IAE55_27235 [Paenibacillus sp. S28]|nr:hypothetical protein [Paenibacillus sp. S28]